MPKLNIKRPCYTMAMTTDGRNAEITMYGEIVETRPVDWWTGKEVAGEFIILSEFLNDLDELKNAQTITIHMNSVGGDGFSAIAIHNRLRELTATKTCIIDGVAMSGGSLIMCACDEIAANPSSIIMIHRCWSYVWGQYNAPALHKLAVGFEAVDKSQAEIYMRKTGKPMDDIMTLMGEETYMTGREAVEAGWADRLTEEDTAVDVSVSADGQRMRVNGHTMRLCALGKLPQTFKTFDTVPGTDGDDMPAHAGEKGGNPMTLEELRRENPELASQLLAEAQTTAQASAVQEERQRLADIDAIAALYDDATVNAAKYGDHACTAQEMAYRAAVEHARQGQSYMANALADTRESGVQNVPAAPAETDDNEPMTAQQRMAAGKAAARSVYGKKEE